MEISRRILCGVFLLLLPVCGCGGDEPEKAARISLCGLACVGEETTGMEVHLSGELGCMERFRRYEAAHPDAVCGAAWASFPTPDCVEAVILVAGMALPCTVRCVGDPNPAGCVARCLVDEVHLKGNCVVCTVEAYLDFFRCVDQEPLTPDDVDACVASYLQSVAGCHR